MKGRILISEIFFTHLARGVKRLIAEKHIYLLTGGRINMCGINPGNIDYVAQSMYDIATTTTED